MIAAAALRPGASNSLALMIALLAMAAWVLAAGVLLLSLRTARATKRLRLSGRDARGTSTRAMLCF